MSFLPWRMLRVCSSPPSDQAFVGTVHFDLEIAPSCAEGGTVVLTYLGGEVLAGEWSPPFTTVRHQLEGNFSSLRLCFVCYINPCYSGSVSGWLASLRRVFMLSWGIQVVVHHPGSLHIYCRAMHATATPRYSTGGARMLPGNQWIFSSHLRQVLRWFSHMYNKYLHAENELRTAYLRVTQI